MIKSSRRRLGSLASTILLAGSMLVVLAAPASAHGCSHSDHTHAHDGHVDSWLFLGHYNYGGTHWHQWENATHGYQTEDACGDAGATSIEAFEHVGLVRV